MQITIRRFDSDNGLQVIFCGKKRKFNECSDIYEVIKWFIYHIFMQIIKGHFMKI